jgi:glyoxylase-like metal-dependent hydrolase (beta-lactamase superfamily II)
VQQLAPGIFIETSFRRVNVGAILTDEGFILIDTPPYPDEARCWREMLADEADKPIIAIINTDWHRDRVVGNSWFNGRAIIAHEDTILQLRNLPSTFIDSAVDSLSETSIERSQFAGAHLRVPTVGFTQRMQIRYGSRSIPLLAMPGPTSGSVWVHLPEERVLFTGDSITVDQHPYIASSYTKNWLDSLTALRRSRFAADHIVPGRGPLVDKIATEEISNYLRLARRRVYSLYRAGRPRADTVTLVPELLEMFPYYESDSERIQRRIKGGLDRIYEEFKLSERMDTLIK